MRMSSTSSRNSANFIPWIYVCADASVAETTSNRHGYTLVKRLFKLNDAAAPQCLYIDEIGRASRDGIEALKLGNFLSKRGRDMIGVSDGFGLSTGTGKIQLWLYAMMNEWFVDQLRSKVRRGMSGSARNGGHLGKPALGYKHVPVTDASGQAVLNANGTPKKKRIVDEDAAAEVRRLFERFANEHWPMTKLAHDMNARHVDGRDNWTSRGISKALQRYSYVGIQIWNRTYQVRNSETDMIELKERPRNEWVVRRRRDLHIVPWRLWKRTQQRLKRIHEEHPLSGRLMNSTQQQLQQLTCWVACQ